MLGNLVKTSRFKRAQSGFTLVEIIIGMVVLAISLTIISGILGPMYVKSADPWHQVRAAELGQGVMNEILSRSYDESSSRSGSLLRCDETGAPACSPEAAFGPDGAESRASFDDVDDYHGLDQTGDAIRNSLDESLAGLYNAYRVRVAVSYRGTELGLADNRRAKRIDVTVTTPTGFDILFSAYKGNW